jgi:hypothetical protein
MFIKIIGIVFVAITAASALWSLMSYISRSELFGEDQNKKLMDNINKFDKKNK